MTITLYDYWQSSAPYRVRLALNLKGLVYDRVAVNLLDASHRQPGYLGVNPQGLVPMLDVDGVRLTQSIAIIEWLDATYPQPPLIPRDPLARARMMAMTYVIAMEIHPVNNLRVRKKLHADFGADAAAVDNWMRHWISEGFAVLEAQADPDQPFLGGGTPGIADLCLVPQMYNARRCGTNLDAFPTLVAIDANCATLQAFQRAHPDAVKPA